MTSKFAGRGAACSGRRAGDHYHFLLAHGKFSVAEMRSAEVWMAKYGW